MDEETLVSGSEDGTSRVSTGVTLTAVQPKASTSWFKDSKKHCMQCDKASTKVDRPACKSCGSTVWNLQSVAGFAFSKDSSLEQKVGKYSITFKDDLLLIAEGRSVVAFFRAPHAISTIGIAGERIGVGCQNGDMLQLRAPWLV